MKKVLFAIIAVAVLTGCQKDKEEYDEAKATRTVVIYIAAENNLGFEKRGNTIYRNAGDDIMEIKEGVKTIGNNHLVLYVDKPMDDVEELDDRIPYMLHFWNGELRDSIPMEESLTSDPKIFEKVLSQAYTKYPAESYGLVLWGHSNGWVFKTDSVEYTSMSRKKAYGGDTGNNTYFSQGNSWMNIPSMAKVLSKMPHLTFIFADCCTFMCLESLYELRHVADYIIGSPAEIPARGAPYQIVTTSLFEPTTLFNGVPQYAKSIVDKYFDQENECLPLSVVKTSEMENMANATRTVLNTFGDQFKGENIYPDLSELIHYFYSYPNEQEYYDANDFMLRYAATADYEAWKKALDRAVIYKKMATRWMTYYSWWSYFTDFEMTEERYGGVSMFVPKYLQKTTDNIRIQQMGWYYAAGYADIGW